MTVRKYSVLYALFISVVEESVGEQMYASLVSIIMNEFCRDSFNIGQQKQILMNLVVTTGEFSRVWKNNAGENSAVLEGTFYAVSEKTLEYLKQFNIESNEVLLLAIEKMFMAYYYELKQRSAYWAANGWN